MEATVEVDSIERWWTPSNTGDYQPLK